MADSEDRAVWKVVGPYQNAWDLHQRVQPADWAVNRQDIAEFEALVREAQAKGEIPEDLKFPNPGHHDPQFGPSIHLINQHVIKPKTAEAGYMSWALMKHPTGLRNRRDGGEHDLMFVTHNWKEGVYEFCRKILALPAYDNLVFWICFLANPQPWEWEDLAKLIGARPEQSPFARALEKTNEMIIVANRAESIYKRLWCVYEIWLGMKLHLSGRVAVPEENYLENVDVGPISSQSEAANHVASFLAEHQDKFNGCDFEGDWYSEGGTSYARLRFKTGGALCQNDFVSIREAQCSSEDDYKYIWGEVAEHVDEIDALVESIRKYGTFQGGSSVLDGVWGYAEGADLTTIAQCGSIVTATNPKQGWSPASGTISASTIHLWGITGVVGDGIITWSNGFVWTRQETSP